MFNREMKADLPQYYSPLPDEIVRKKDLESKKKGKDYHDRNAKESFLKVGDRVLLKQKRQNKLSTRYEDEDYVIVGRKGNAIRIRSESGDKFRNESDVNIHSQVDQSDQNTDEFGKVDNE